MTPTLTRRDFLKSGTAAGTSLVVAAWVPALARAEAARSPDSEVFQPNVWIEIATDGAVRIWTGRSEMGQGVRTAMPMIVAEELDADWERVEVVQAPADPAYGDQFTTGSRSVATGWMPLRKAGAAAREMLAAAAAGTWGVPRDQCRTERGVVEHTPTRRRLDYGTLVGRAVTLPVPQDPPLKPRSAFTLVGRPVPRVDTPAKVAGRAVYGLDVRVPGMRFAAVARCPVFGGSVASFDAAPALAVPGVREVFEIPQGVAVVAGDTWAAIRGRDALRCTWDVGPTARWSSAGISNALADATERPGRAVREEGDVEAGLARAAQLVRAEYEVPYLAHACLEPVNATARVADGECEIWAPTQIPQQAQEEAARILGIPRERVTLHVTYLGGGFGRKGTDFVAEAVEISRRAGEPVQVVWTREDDIRHGFYRPATYNRLVAGLDQSGGLIGWRHRLAASPGPPWMITMGAADVPYAVPSISVEQAEVDVGIPLQAWRSIGPSQNCFVVESFMDEVAHAAGADPYEFRRRLLEHSPRHVGVLDHAAQRAAWGTPIMEGRARGIALQRFGDTFCAQVAEVSLDAARRVRVHRVACAVDCGIVVNPDTVIAQMQGGIVYGLTAALYGEITIEQGAVNQGNFDDYPMLRLPEMPRVEVEIVESDEPPGGIGEPATPPIAPAVANAVFALTGVRVRKLPIGIVPEEPDAGRQLTRPPR